MTNSDRLIKINSSPSLNFSVTLPLKMVFQDLRLKTRQMNYFSASLPRPVPRIRERKIQIINLLSITASLTQHVRYRVTASTLQKQMEV